MATNLEDFISSLPQNEQESINRKAKLIIEEELALREYRKALFFLQASPAEKKYVESLIGVENKTETVDYIKDLYQYFTSSNKKSLKSNKKKSISNKAQNKYSSSTLPKITISHTEQKETSNRGVLITK